jgi:hypothetical protein
MFTILRQLIAFNRIKFFFEIINEKKMVIILMKANFFIVLRKFEIKKNSGNIIEEDFF